MKNIARKVVDSTKKFVANHKVGLAFTAGLAVAIPLNKWALREHDNFLKEHDLYDAYYTPTD